MSHSLGIDIGGANLKVADSRDFAETIPFELWKKPEQLLEALRGIASAHRHLDRLGVTMTGELCDCYPTKREGVVRIVSAVKTAFRGWTVRIWGTLGNWLTPEHAESSPLEVAAANWHLLATWVGSTVATGNSSLLIDTGSTTTDIIPIVQHMPQLGALTDWTRLASRELVYTGVRRTPLCALMTEIPSMAEFFATSEDVYVLLGMLPERLAATDTADGRPMTAENARYRIARMIGSDGEILSRRETIRLAVGIFTHQQRLIREAIEQVLSRQAGILGQVIFSGSGEFLARAAWERLVEMRPDLQVVEDLSLTEILGEKRAEAACAYAAARLLESQ